MADDPTKKPVKAAFGERMGTLAWIAVGAAVGAALLAPLVMRWLNVTFEWAMMIGGAAAALIFGLLSKVTKGRADAIANPGQTLGQGAAVFGVALFGAKILAPILQNLPVVGKWFGGAGAATETTTDPLLVGLA